MKVVIAGYGIEGRTSYEYWRSLGAELTIADERSLVDDLPQDVPTILDKDAFSQLIDFDLVIRAPSVNPYKLPYGAAVWSATNEFFVKCPVPIIGITGTKGKGTTASLIASILRAAGRKVHLVGNIGTPALSELSKIQPDDLVVFELSSFQLWDAIKSPHVAVILPIEPDHLDVHDSLEDYHNAKANIARYQTTNDTTVFYQNNEISAYIATLSIGHKIPYPFPIDDVVSSLKLPGRHNQDNAAAAIAAVSEYVSDETQIRDGLAAFDGLPHRLKFVANKAGVSYYDDSISTTPGSAIAAMDAFDQPKTIILGGSSKGVMYDEIIARCKQENVRVVAVGQTGHGIAELCSAQNVPCQYQAGDMTAIVNAAAKVSQVGDVVILSPASASFDMFKNYADRGEQFIAAVDAL